MARIGVGQPFTLSNWGQGPYQAHLDLHLFNSLMNPYNYPVDPTFGQYKGEWQLEYSTPSSYDGHPLERGSFIFQKDMAGINTTSYDLFLPNNTADEKKSVFYHLKDVPGISTIQGPYNIRGAPGTAYQTITDGTNAILGLWLDAYNLLRNDVTAEGDTYGGGGIHCWQSSGDWSYYGASPTQPSDCPSGWINGGIASMFTQGANSAAANRYNYNPNNFNPDSNYDYGGTGYFRDSRGYGWDNFVSSPSYYIWTQLIPEMLSKHDPNGYARSDPFVLGTYQSTMFWAWLTGRNGTNPVYGTQGAQSAPFGCSASWPYFALAVRRCYKAYYNVI
jgi:hypothetical protein